MQEMYISHVIIQYIYIFFFYFKKLYICLTFRLDDGLHGYLLGDSGYAQRVYVMTPYMHPEGATQEAYNMAHSVTRVWVEHLFGMWKRKFACLNGMQYIPER